jgi:hypothetical protein
MTAGTSLQLATSIVFFGLFLTYFRRFSRIKSNALSRREGSGRIFWGVIAIEFFIILR